MGKGGLLQVVDRGCRGVLGRGASLRDRVVSSRLTNSGQCMNSAQVGS